MFVLMAWAVLLAAAGLPRAQAQAMPPVTPMGPESIPAAPPAPLMPAATPAVVQAAPAAWARVVSVSTLAHPAIPAQQVCSEPSDVASPTSGAGALAGAVIGGAVGSQLGGGSGQALATAAGAVSGALLGQQAEAAGRTASARSCVVQGATASGVSYQVVYEYGGQHYAAVLPFHPGALLQVQVLPALPPGASSVAVAPPMVGVIPVVPPGVVMVSPGVWAAAPAALVVGAAGPYWVGSTRWVARGHRHWRHRGPY